MMRLSPTRFWANIGSFARLVAAAWASFTMRGTSNRGAASRSRCYPRLPRLIRGHCSDSASRRKQSRSSTTLISCRSWLWAASTAPTIMRCSMWKARRSPRSFGRIAAAAPAHPTRIKRHHARRTRRLLRNPMQSASRPSTAKEGALASERSPPGRSLLRGSAGRGRDAFQAIASLAAQAADALDHAHAMGILHRDIKPSNLLVDGAGNLWVTDFGLARFQDEPGLTRTGDLLGTLRYMAPETRAGPEDGLRPALRQLFARRDAL